MKVEVEPSPFSELLRNLGEQHEKNHLETFSDFVDLSSVDLNLRYEKTVEAIQSGADVIYQGAFSTIATMNDIEVEFVGYPDFLIKEGSNYIIRDTKLAKNVSEKEHVEISKQLVFYGWLFEEVIGEKPFGLEVLNGENQIINIPYDDESIADAMNTVSDILKLKIASNEPYSPVGWSKCNGCDFRERCWPIAENNKDVALVYGVDQGLASALHSTGENTFQKLLDSYNETTLSELVRPWGKGTQRVGSRASSILSMAKSLNENIEIELEPVLIKKSPNYVMFDLEGLPPYIDEIEKIYLWGTQVFGENPGEFHAALSGFGSDGDREGWMDFLSEAERLFDRFGDIPFVHWASYEKTKINLYIDRFGDRDNIAERVLENLLDLLPITRSSIALPIPSYSLKVIEKYIGYKRTLDEFGGEWSIVKFIEATEAGNKEDRNKIMNSILDYNREDLEATWAVFEWLIGY